MQGFSLELRQAVLQRQASRLCHRGLVLQVGHDPRHFRLELALEILLLGPDVYDPRMTLAVPRGQLGLLAGQLGLLLAQVAHNLRGEDLCDRLDPAAGPNHLAHAAEPGLCLSLVGTGQDQLPVEIRELLLADRDAPGIDQVVLGPVDLDGALGIPDLLAQ